MSYMQKVFFNSDLVSLALSYIDPLYEEFLFLRERSQLNVLTYSVDYFQQYCFLMLQTFKSLYRAMYRNIGSKSIRWKSKRVLYVTSWSLCKWSKDMGILMNCTTSWNGSICSLVCKSSNLLVLQHVVSKYPRWKPSLSDIVGTVVNGNVNQLQWLKSSFNNVIVMIYSDSFFHKKIHFSNFCSFAASEGQILVLQWLRSQDPSME